jgi:hypothetical protein
LAEFYSSALESSPLTCGICALELSNTIHGINRKKLNGPIAESMRLKAIEWRKNEIANPMQQSEV